MNEDILIEIRNLKKTFGGIKALDNVLLSINKSEIHGLIGRNGAGKSTLIKIISGDYFKDSGTIIFNGEQVNFKNPLDAINVGIHTVYQDFPLCENLTVWENVSLSDVDSLIKFINKKNRIKKCKEILAQLNLNLNVNKKITDISSAERQMISIAKALYSRNLKILILDEPTSTLSIEEKNNLFNIIKKLKESGVTVLFVSHNINEVLNLCDKVTIFRDGKLINTVLKNNFDEQEIIYEMIGKKHEEYKRVNKLKKENLLFKVSNIITNKINIKEVDVNKGEIVGLIGLEGSGASELLRTICGINDNYKNKIINILLDNKNIQIRNINDSIENGIIYIPEDTNEGLISKFSVLNNLITLKINSFSKYGFIKKKSIENYCENEVKKFNIICSSINSNISNLSGGNQRKVIISKFLSKNPKLLLLDDPTKGVDIGAKYEIYRIIKKYCTEKGSGIIFRSTELEEILLVCDRIIILFNGRIIKVMDIKDASKQKLISFAMGLENIN